MSKSLGCWHRTVSEFERRGDRAYSISRTQHSRYAAPVIRSEFQGDNFGLLPQLPRIPASQLTLPALARETVSEFRNPTMLILRKWCHRDTIFTSRKTVHGMLCVQNTLQMGWNADLTTTRTPFPGATTGRSYAPFGDMGRMTQLDSPAPLEDDYWGVAVPNRKANECRDT